MKVYWLSLFSGFIVLVSFQNCQKAPHRDEISYLPQNATQVEVASKVSLNEQSLSQVYFFTKEPESVVRNNRTYSVLVNKTQQIELDSGIITQQSDLSDEVKTLCLTQELKNELLQILKSSSICKIEKNNDPNLNCSQALVPPYARIITSSDQYDLGSATDGCGSNSMDLCSEQATLLKGFIAHLKTQLGNLNCP